MSEVNDETAARLYPDARIIEHPGDDGFAHIWATGPDGVYQPLVDYHLVCMGTNCFTQTQPDGTLKHVCRDCLEGAAVALDTPEHRSDHNPPASR